jgi:hypothetical protein
VQIGYFGMISPNQPTNPQAGAAVFQADPRGGGGVMATPQLLPGAPVVKK